MFLFLRLLKILIKNQYSLHLFRQNHLLSNKTRMSLNKNYILCRNDGALTQFNTTVQFDSVYVNYFNMMITLQSKIKLFYIHYDIVRSLYQPILHIKRGIRPSYTN